MLDDDYWEPPSREEVARHTMGRLRKLMAERDIDALIVNRSDNLRYITGVMPTDNIIFANRQAALLTRTREQPILFAASHYAKRVTKRFWIQDIRPLPRVQDTWPALFHRALVDAGITSGVVALDPFMFYATARRIEGRLKDYRVVDAGEMLGEARVRKTDDEIALIDAACALGEISMREGFDAAREGITEVDLAGRMSYVALAAGAEGLYARRGTLVSSGEKLALHQESPTRKRLRQGEFVLMDVGPMVGGYYCDFARTIFLGEPTREQRAIYAAAYNALWAAIAAIKPGVHGADLHAASLAVLERARYADHSTPLVGHGVGTTAQEPPYIVPQEYADLDSIEATDVVLEPNMVLALSSGVFVPGAGGCRFEETVRVTASGYQVLSRTPYPRYDELLI